MGSNKPQTPTLWVIAHLGGSKCPAQELQPLSRSSPHVLAFNTTILNRVASLRLQQLGFATEDGNRAMDSMIPSGELT